METSTTDPTATTPTPTDRLTKCVPCPQCPWRAQLTYDLGEDVDTFLIKKLREHVADVHMGQAS